MSRHYSLYPYCIGCHLLEAACICTEAPRLALGTRVIVVAHAAEWARSSNTGHLVRLGLTNATVLLHGRRGARIEPEQLVAPGATPVVLYPRRGGEALTPELAASMARPITLIVPDGNWNQTHHMMRRLLGVIGARIVSLDDACRDINRSRHNTDATRRSTFEAIARAVGILEGTPYEERLIELYRLMLTGKDGRPRGRLAYGNPAS